MKKKHQPYMKKKLKKNTAILDGYNLLQSLPPEPVTNRGIQTAAGRDENTIRVTTDIERINEMAECKACGHRDTQHAKFGCNQGFCKCEMSNQDVIDFEKLSALREAGEKMAKQLREMRDYTGGTFTAEDAAALAEWEAANK